MDGYQEAPATLNSPGSGEFVARIRQDGSAIDYTLTYRNLASPIRRQPNRRSPAR
jgi:hypothetical protein